MRILFVNQYYAPDFAATAQQLSDICEYLAGQGHEVHVLASRAIYDGRPLDLPSEEVLNGVHVHRVGLSTNGRDRIRQRLAGYASFYLKSFLKTLALPRFDMVVTLTTPPMIGLLGAWLRLTRRSRFVYWVMDVYPDIAIRAGVLSRLGVARGIWSLIGRFSYLAANRVVVLGEDMREVIERKRVSNQKIDVIPSWSDGGEVHPVPHAENSFREKNVPQGAFALMYSGNMGTCHSFDSAIEGIQSLAENSDVRFLFVGGGKQLPRLKEGLAAQQNVAFLPYQDRAALAESLSAADAHLVTLSPKYDGLLVPSKVYGIMAAGRPILFVGSENNQIARIISRTGCGIVVKEGDAAAFRNATLWMASHPEEVREMGERGRRCFEEQYEKRHSLRTFRDMLQRESLAPGLRGMRHPAHHVEAESATLAGAIPAGSSVR